MSVTHLVKDLALHYRKYLEKIISIDTQIHNSTLEAVNWIKSIFEEYNIPVELIYNQDKTRASLIATVGDKSQAGYVFSGHLDTVAADESFYKQRAFNLLDEGDKFYGRGVCDMKGSIVCFLAAIPEIIKSGKTASLVLSHDEEGGFQSIKQITTTPEVVSFLGSQKACIVMEPSNLEPVIAHKGTRLSEVSVVGKSGHSSNPSICIDAIDIAVNSYNHIVGSFNQLSKKYGPSEGFIEPHSTICVGKFNGGEAINTVSANACYSLLSRENPDNDYDTFFKNILKDFETKGKITIEEKLYAYAFKSSCNIDFVKSIKPNYKIVNYGTEAGFFENIGLPTIVCGPGDIAQAHTKDEYIYKEQLDKWQNMILDIISK